MAKQTSKKLTNPQKITAKLSRKTKKTNAKPRVNSEGKRVRNIQKHKTFKLSKKTVKLTRPLPSIKSLIKDPVKLILSNKKIFLYVTLIYASLTFVFIKGFGTAFNLSEVKDQLAEYFGEESKDFEKSYILFEYLVGSLNGSLGEVAGTYQLFFSIVFMLAVIWLCRKLLAGEKPKVKQAFYQGMYPIIPFVLVLFVITLQLIPMAIGNFLVSTVINNDLAVTVAEKALWVVIFLLLATLTLYMVTSSLFALCIVTLQDLTPMQALRSARDLVIHRRFGVFVRLLLLPIIGFVLLALIFMPIVLVAPLVAEPLFLLATSFGLVFSVVYVYNLYRKLL